MVPAADKMTCLLWEIDYICTGEILAFNLTKDKTQK